ncbi:MAG: hypothetical protein V7L20_15935 [Nostoc sp.]
MCILPTFQLKAQNLAGEVLADTKKYAMGQPRANHLYGNGEQIRAIAN